MKEKNTKTNGVHRPTKNSGQSMNGKQGNGPLLRAELVSDEELARRIALKKYFDSLDEETHIREFEKLSLDDMHFLAWAYTAEKHRKGKRLT